MAIGHLRSHRPIDYLIVFSPTYPSILCLLEVLLIVRMKFRPCMVSTITVGALASTLLYMILQAAAVVTKYHSLKDDFSDYGWTLMMPLLLIGIPALLIGCGIAAIVYQDRYRTSNMVVD